MSRLNRRTFLVTGLAAGGSLAVPGISASAPSRSRRLAQNPFQIGIASGDPLSDSVVLWTRLAPAPLDPDGGMGTREVDVEWQLATDEGFTDVIANGTETAIADEGHSVHAEATGLPAGGEFFYRFKADGHESEIGRTRTAPAGDAASLKVCMASCQHFEAGWYHAYKFLAADEPDLVLFLGDYMYEARTDDQTVRKYLEVDEADKQHEYRMRYAQHKTDPQLRAAHAIAPWIVVFDDHEVENNWNAENQSAERLQWALQGFWENQPLRKNLKPVDSAIPLYRRLKWGNLANLHMMDTRQYRTAQAEADDCAAIEDPDRTLIGADQEKWLLEGFAAGGAQWDLLGQQVFFAQRDTDGSADTCDRSTDAWDGYLESRNRVVQGLLDSKVRNPVVLTGDVHTAWANNIKQDYFDEASPTIGSELVTTSITSMGSDPDQEMLDNNPHVNFVTSERGYTRFTVDGAQITSEFVTVSSVFEPDPSKVTAEVAATFTIQDGTPGVQPA